MNTAGIKIYFIFNIVCGGCRKGVPNGAHNSAFQKVPYGSVLEYMATQNNINSDSLRKFDINNYIINKTTLYTVLVSGVGIVKIINVKSDKWLKISSKIKRESIVLL